MPRTTQPLAPALRPHLTAVSQADLDWRDAKRDAHERARRAADDEIAQKRAIRDAAVRSAVDAGLPLIELRRKHQGLHTTNAQTVLDSLARTEPLGLAA